MKTLALAALAALVLRAAPALAQAPEHPSSDAKLDLKLELEDLKDEDSVKGMLKCGGGMEKEKDGKKWVEYPDDKCGFAPGTLRKKKILPWAIKKKILDEDDLKKQLPPIKKKMAEKLAALHLADDELKKKIAWLKEKQDDSSKADLKKAIGAYKKFYSKLEKATKECAEVKLTKCPAVPEKIRDID